MILAQEEYGVSNLRINDQNQLGMKAAKTVTNSANNLHKVKHGNNKREYDDFKDDVLKDDLELNRRKMIQRRHSGMPTRPKTSTDSV